MGATTHQQILVAKMLRRKLTPAEAMLWAKLRELPRFKFRRQQPIGKYVVDFVCFEHKIIVEIDGGQHSKIPNQITDAERTSWLESQGFCVLRFWNNDVLNNSDGVIISILEHQKKDTLS